ncbi:MAG: hypothetical protein VKL39_15525 [Leptolyngbyaceae bacterium]|nr:hypothetical protein [Leptolyngbyaceae bacterium]
MNADEFRERYETALDLTLNRLQTAILFKSQAVQLCSELDQESRTVQQLLTLLENLEASVYQVRETLINLSEDFENFLSG